MADRLYLSYWLRGFTERNMLRHFEKLLRTFPFSTLSGGAVEMRVYALEYAEPPVLERFFDRTTADDVGVLIDCAREFQNPDCGYLVESYWDLWRYDNEWRLEPAQVILACFGPLFQNDLGDHLRIEFGLDSDFLPQPELPDSSRRVQSNIKGLLRLTHELDNSLPFDKRQLWSESGENFADRLHAALL